ncbi:class I SAM-dependent methyltransferase [Bradyrhizobium sp. 76]|uniref:class I SAM-dependent methyltransferase n=1 Tax=Bradyrhizobium sp. 76 TaxID=2782680 RepID=UPI001FFA7485|nr:class I SAM-dependent methyltransferase [Bradyrhizobium sp. 76]MCK1404939.1 class I SAM-dependent methyltransferase [Bradyrhizobium sp. 76]
MVELFLQPCAPVVAGKERGASSCGASQILLARKVCMQAPIEACLACGHDHFEEPMTLREMMFGFREEFKYHVCSSCRTIQACFDIGPDLAKYYPVNYYSFNSQTISDSALKLFLVRRRSQLFFAGGLFAELARRVKDDAFLREMIDIGVTPKIRILDVGCGDGSRLKELARRGLKNLVGIDPFIKNDILLPNITVKKGDLTSVRGKFDLIMFNHSLEHIPDPVEAMRHVKTILADDGQCVVRIPTCSSDAYERYGKDWVQLDPPRHYFIPSLDGMKRLGQRSGLRQTNVIFDGRGWTYLASEQYKRDVPLFGPTSQHDNPSVKLFTQAEIANFENLSLAANKTSRGDQAAFVFRHSNDS